jgi:asparagine synthase (glutamine-hydrolysing)
MRFGFLLLCDPEGNVEVRRREPAARRGRPEPLVSLARDPRSRLVCLLLGRLFYRDDLLRRLPPQEPPGPRADVELALAAYRHAGRQGLEWLEGEFSLALWDGAARRVVGLRDPFGAWPLFWQAGAGGLALGTSLEDLAARQPSRSFDLDYLAAFLMRPYPAEEMPCERTAYEHVRRILPGTLLEWTPAGGARVHRWWDWAARVETAPVSGVEEAGERFGQLLREAVRERVRRGRTASHLSGGMDSSSVACLARDWIAAGVGQGPLLTVSNVYQRPSLAGERAFIDLVLKQGGPVEPILLPGDAALDFDWFPDRIPRHDEPYGGLAGLAKQALPIEAAAGVEADYLLTGLGSDEMLDNGPLHIADLLRRGRWLAAVREAARWARGVNEGLWWVLRHYGLEPLFPVLTREGLGPLLRGGFGKWPSLGWFTVPPWIRPDFARRHGMRRAGREFARRLYGHPAARSVDLETIAMTTGDWSSWYLAGPRGLCLSHPFRDPRLVCFGLSIPVRLRAVPGANKPVLQAAMRGVLPEGIRTRIDKKGFNDVHGLGLLRSLPRLEEMVRGCRLAELDLLDGEAFVEVLHQAAMGIGDVQACERVDKTLALIAWFDQAAGPRPPEEPAETQHWRGTAGHLARRTPQTQPV